MTTNLDMNLIAALALELRDKLPTRVPGNDRWVIVRSRDAGVQYGQLVSYESNGTVYLKNARQMWQWKAARGGTLLDCAGQGVTPAECKFSESKSTLVVFGACAIIDVEPAAQASYSAVKW